jgi:hypothetical protein
VLIYGGSGHEQFLGCLSCSEYDANSVWNQFSQHGWQNPYGTWSTYAQYKNPYTAYSACNEYATDPPVLVDQNGTFYGRLSINLYISGSVCGISGVPQVCQALQGMCARE